MFKNIPASGIPVCAPFLLCDLARKQYPVMDGGSLMAIVIAPGKSLRSIVKARNRLGVISTYPFLKEDHYV